MNEQAPSISVVVASKVGAPFLGQCLRSLERQAAEMRAEVIVVATGDKVDPAQVAAEFPWVQVVHEPGLKQIPALRRRGVEKCTGDLVAVIEEHCAAADDWLRQAAEAHRRGDYGAVGGPIADANYSRLRDWVVYFCEYNSAMPPVGRGPTDTLNDANIVYRRSVLLEHRDLLDDGYWPMKLHPTLLAEGITLYSEPDVIVHHCGPFNFGYYLHQRFLFSRAFAGVRARKESLSHRLAYLIGAPIIPLVLLSRMTRIVLARGSRVRQFVRTLPLTLPALTVLVAGEWVGYLLGPGDALSKVE